MKTWKCGDCGTQWPKSQKFCAKSLDDYLSLRGGSIEAAIRRTVQPRIDRVAKKWERRTHIPGFAIAA